MTEPPVINRLDEWRLLLALVTTAIVAALVPIPSSTVERFYSAGFYQAIQPALTSLSNRFQFPLFDAALVALVAAWTALAAHDFARQPKASHVARRLVIRTATWAAAGYLIFLVAWGLNYRRLRLIETLPFDASRMTDESVEQAMTTAARRLNALYQPGRDGEQPGGAIDPTLTGAMQQALTDIGRTHRLVPGRPKRTLLDPYFRRAGVDGMTDPFFLETLIATDVLPFERPQVIAHEWAHLAGINDEGEANFVGWLACLRASPAAQYSGWLFIFRELGQSVPGEARKLITASLGPGPRADLRAINDRIIRNVNPRISAVGWSVYDSYLKANRVEAGAASYGEVVRLVVGTRLASGWDPLAPTSLEP